MPIEDFPPFYTRQPNETTWLEQRQQWVQSILTRSTTYKIWTIDNNGNVLHASPPPELLNSLPSNLFNNEKINRKLDSSTILEILSYMQKLNNIKPIAVAKKTAISAVAGTGGRKLKDVSYLVFWTSPDQWASIILEWIERTGQTGSILTLFEIQSVKDEPFEGINEEILKLALDVLNKRGRASIMRDEGAVVGVKIQ